MCLNEYISYVCDSRFSRMPYFRINEKTGNYEKTVMINKERWHLIVYPSLWSHNTSRAISRWINNVQHGRNPVFRWGEIHKGDENAQVVEYEPHTCDHCSKVFGSRSGLWKHERLCKQQIVPENTREYIASNHVTVESGGTQINNSSFHNTININIRDFGKENPGWLTENILYSVIGNVDRAIPILMKKKHFNDQFPENMNVRLNTKSDINKRLQVRENGKWRLRDSKQTFYKVVIDTYEILYDALTDEDDFDESHPEVEKARRSQKFLEKVNRIKPLWEEFHKKILNEEDPEMMKELWEDLKTLILDRKLCAEQE
jgi:hypothetical protein